MRQITRPTRPIKVARHRASRAKKISDDEGTNRHTPMATKNVEMLYLYLPLEGKEVEQNEEWKEDTRKEKLTR
jgi:hypothetical protein